MTLNNIFSKLRKRNIRDYRQLIFCITFAVTLVASFAITVFSPFIQSTLPVGGDSRKQVYMIFVVAILGCMIFCIYAANLFFRYKSRQIGVFLALGAEKKTLSKSLFSEIMLITGVCSGIGIAIGLVLAVFIGLIFRKVTVFMPEDDGVISLIGFLVAALFCMVMIFALMIQAVAFMKRTNLMEIINEQRRNEPVKANVTGKYAIVGIILLAIGVFGGLVLPAIIARTMEINIGPLAYVFYILCMIGLYMLMVYGVAVHKKGKNPGKYYKNMITYGMVKFQGASVVKNMVIIALLLIAALFSCFYGPTQYMTGQVANKSNNVDFAYHYMSDIDEVTKEEVADLAKQHQVQVQDYRETQMIRLLASGVERENYDSKGRLIEIYKKQYCLNEFISQSEYNRVTGQHVELADGHYKHIKAADTEANIWKRFGDLDYVQNTVSKTEMKLQYDGTTDYQGLVRLEGFDTDARYVISDNDFAQLSKKLPESSKVTQVLFNVADLEGSYEFAKALYKEYCLKATPEIKKMSGFDEFQQAQVKKAGKFYGYGTPVELQPDRSEIDLGWKYQPNFKILNLNNAISSFIVFYLLFIFVAVVCLAAVGIIGYTRSISIGINSKQTFEDLKRLGANHRYIRRLIGKQLSKVYVMPCALGSLLIFSYQFIMLWQNDGRLTTSEWMTLGIDLGIVLIVGLYLYSLYRVSFNRVKEIVEVNQ